MCIPKINHEITSVASSIVPDPPGNIKKASPNSNNFFFLSVISLTTIVSVISKFLTSLDTKISGITPITLPSELNADCEILPIKPTFPPP